MRDFSDLSVDFGGGFADTPEYFRFRTIFLKNTFLNSKFVLRRDTYTTYYTHKQLLRTEVALLVRICGRSLVNANKQSAAHRTQREAAKQTALIHHTVYIY